MIGAEFPSISPKFRLAPLECRSALRANKFYPGDAWFGLSVICGAFYRTILSVYIVILLEDCFSAVETNKFFHGGFLRHRQLRVIEWARRSEGGACQWFMTPLKPIGIIP
jgi:hypothetical protein